ncbi:hypothetical protein B0H14DRAFT_3710253 [Mycena olivaceomarginata]|nr:hypothetical protein B0H14DRAFT_3710253 [Mycena olivaceomarginata]
MWKRKQPLLQPAPSRAAQPAPSRAAQPRQRVLVLESKHRLEDAEALKFTDQEQHILLFLSFRSVKLYPSTRLAAPVGRPFPQTQLHTGTWDPIHPPALPLSPHANVHSYSYPAPAAPLHSYLSPSPAASEALALLTNTHLVSFGKDDTICVRQPSYSAPTSTHSTHAVAFPVNADDDDKGGDEDEEMTAVDDQDHAEDGDGELPTPVPWRSGLLVPQQGGGEEPQTPVLYSYEREAMPTPYSEAEQERKREGEQVGGKRKR